MGEYIESFTDEQKRVLLSLIAIEKVTTLKMHREDFRIIYTGVICVFWR